MKNPTVSFDFDDTLSTNRVQLLAKMLISRGINVIIVTARNSDKNNRLKDWNNDDLFYIAKTLHIPEKNIYFCGTTRKCDFLNRWENIIWHLDDSNGDVIQINAETETVGISCLEAGWFQQCLILLNIKPMLNLTKEEGLLILNQKDPAYKFIAQNTVFVDGTNIGMQFVIQCIENKQFYACEYTEDMEHPTEEFDFIPEFYPVEEKTTTVFYYE